MHIRILKLVFRLKGEIEIDRKKVSYYKKIKNKPLEEYYRGIIHAKHENLCELNRILHSEGLL